MANSQLELIALSITKSKNPTIFMVNTNKGGFPVRKTALDKRGITVGDSAYKFAEPTVVVIAQHKAGEFIFGYDETGKPAGAPQDSSRLNEQGEPVYKAGDTPKWSEDGATVKTFVSFQEWKAQKEMDKLMATA